jgi:CHAT domain-containing protein
VHFACHALSAWRAPSSSRLLLTDHDVAPLDVPTVSRLRLTHADLAFLSACSTIETGPRLADEAVNLAAAFQVAGFRQVVGTLWPVPDPVAIRAASAFYSRLCAEGDLRLDRAPHALHETVAQLRQRYPDSPAAWTAYAHSGI